MTVPLDPVRISKSDTSSQEDERSAGLTDLLSETRILLPGTEVFLGFLMTMPFTDRFERLADVQRVVYLCTFFGALLALVCFVLPAAYHRITRPIRHKDRFKRFASLFLVIGLVPLSLSIVLITWLITSLVEWQLAWIAALVMSIAIGIAWWALPLARAHDHFDGRG
ncbi:DUF6328 family protein [Pendulispora albinea]|uniref:DUF6328 family protein n=1 Tax=Pendulispora albinea TaxID=2741071 RepID=A0ABZ2LVI7_9BACT